MARISSPCLQHCVVDPSSGLCEGCGRSLAEIASWSRLSEEQRVVIMADLPARLRLASSAGLDASRPDGAHPASPPDART